MRMKEDQERGEKGKSAGRQTREATVSQIKRLYFQMGKA